MQAALFIKTVPIRSIKSDLIDSFGRENLYDGVEDNEKDKCRKNDFLRSL